MSIHGKGNQQHTKKTTGRNYCSSAFETESLGRRRYGDELGRRRCHDGRGGTVGRLATRAEIGRLGFVVEAGVGCTRRHFSPEIVAGQAIDALE
jgi:hypothetical protein